MSDELLKDKTDNERFKQEKSKKKKLNSQIVFIKQRVNDDEGVVDQSMILMEI